MQLLSIRQQLTIAKPLGAKTLSDTHHSTGKMARDMSDKEILQMELAQLKIEVSTTRTAVSVNCKETMEWVEAQTEGDPLIKGVSDDKNPYKGDKGGCIIT